MTSFYVEMAQKFMNEGKWRYAETAIQNAIGAANREKSEKRHLFRALNFIRQVSDDHVR